MFFGEYYCYLVFVRDYVSGEGFCFLCCLCDVCNYGVSCGSEEGLLPFRMQI